MNATRLLEHNGLQIQTCPRGCSESEIEVGRATESFMAVFNAPPQYLRCCACGFHDAEGKESLRYSIGDAVSVWNDACVSYSQESVS